MLERTIETKAVEFCRKHGVLCYKFTSPSHRGVPDRLLVFPNGEIHFIEFKQPHGRLSKLQQFEHARLTKQGASVVTFWHYAVFEAWMSFHL